MNMNQEDEGKEIYPQYQTQYVTQLALQEQQRRVEEWYVLHILSFFHKQTNNLFCYFIYLFYNTIIC